MRPDAEGYDSRLDIIERLELDNRYLERLLDEVCAERDELARESERVGDRLASAWDEGFDAGERDVFMHNEEGWDAECVANPYREKGRR